MSIEVSGITKQYGEQKAVNNISFFIKKGEIVGFLGPNGAGKSTTMKMITGYLTPDTGNIRVCGVDVVRNQVKAKKLEGYLPESNPLYYDMYVREYLKFIAEVHKVKDPRQKVEEAIALTGLLKESKKRTGQLSKGYKQRVGLAAALIHDPEVLILDEPTSGLDPNQVVEIRNVIKEQGKEKTVLFSSHILQEVQAICDRIIIINKGRIVADDTLKHLQQDNNYNMVRVAFKESLETEWLQRLPAVKSVQNEGMYWLLQTPDPTSTRKQLLELAVEENLNIVSMQTEGSNLEEIFRSLTLDTQEE